MKYFEVKFIEGTFRVMAFSPMMAFDIAIKELRNKKGDKTYSEIPRIKELVQKQELIQFLSAKKESYFSNLEIMQIGELFASSLETLIQFQFFGECTNW